MSSLKSYRHTNCEAERSGSRIMNISTHKAFFLTGFQRPDGQSLPIPKVFNLLFVLGEPKLYWLIPRSIGLSAYHTIFCTLSFLGKTNATVRTLSFSITSFFLNLTSMFPALMFG